MRKAYFILGWLLSVFLINILLLQAIPGISLVILMAIFIAFYEIGKLVYFEKLRLSTFQLLIIPLLYFAAVFAFRMDGIVLFWSGLLIVSILPVYMVLSARPDYFKKITELGLFELTIGMAIAPLITRIPSLIPVKPKGRTLRLDNLDGKLIAKVLIGLVIALPTFFIALILLLAADSVFAGFLGDVIPRFDSHSLINLFVSLIIGTVAVYYSISYFRSKFFNKLNLDLPVATKVFRDQIIPLIIILPLNLIYILFTLVQFGYLFGGKQFVESRGIVFSEYAISGFWEMIFVALINFGVLYLLLSRFSLKTILNKVLLIPNYLIIICATLVMVISAHSRLSLYESAYGYTVDRLQPHLFLVFIVMMLVLFGVTVLLKDPLRRPVLMIGSFSVVILFLMGFSLFSMERFIVQRNVEIFADKTEGTLKIDADYLVYELGYEGQSELYNLEKQGQLKTALNLRDDYAWRNKEGRVGYSEAVRMVTDSIEREANLRRNWQSWNFQVWQTGYSLNDKN